MKKVIVIGGGPAGMFAALTAAEDGHAVILLEKNEKLGKKLFITGKGRCNLTNAGDMDALFANVATNRKFLYSAFYAYDNFRVIDFFEKHGVLTKTERGNRVFPVSDHSSDVIAALRKALMQAGVQIRLYTKAAGLLTGDGRIQGVLLENGERLLGDAVVVATGGCSYQSTGSTGDGYLFAQKCGHTIVRLRPALVPFTAKEAYVTDMQGLTLKNVRVTVLRGKKVLFEDFGEMLFTHFGVSGPLCLSASSAAGDLDFEREGLEMRIDLKPALSAEQLDKRLVRDFLNNQNKQFKNAVHGLLPAKMLPAIIALSEIDPEKKVHAVTREERGRLGALLKAFPVTLTGLRGFEEAVITRGGVSVKEVNPSTMESRLVSGLYFSGEVLDLDALTGGFNLQIAWSTGYLAGNSIG